jgi:leucyl aminopeptidase (aminopeptidase T)
LEEQNNATLEFYSQLIERLQGMVIETQGEGEIKTPYRYYFNHVGAFLLQILAFEGSLDENYFVDRSYNVLKLENEKLYEDVIGDRYTYSYANPKYCAKVFGDKTGQMMSFLYTEIRGCIVDAFEHRLFELTIFGELLLEMYDYIFSHDDLSQTEMRDIFYNFYMTHMDYFVERRTREIYDPSLSFATDIIMESDLNDLRYLFKYGEYISKNEIKVAEYFNQLPQENIDLMANTFTEAYFRGFERENIDLTNKRTVNIRYNIGFERVVRKAIENFRERNLEPVLYRYAVRSISKRQHLRIGYSATSPNKQFDYDHRFDQAVYLDENYVNLRMQALRNALDKYKELAKAMAGPAVVEIFGEQPFVPKNKLEAFNFTKDQQKLSTNLMNQTQQLTYEYVSADELSFTIIAFPIPEIGENFEEIFDEIIKVNTLDNKRYEEVHQTIIDVLDQADYIHVKGTRGNLTDIVVKLHDLKDPTSETKFENCVADVNVPVGEVFTSPVLADTHGVLHVKEVFLNELKYENLILRFKDGYIHEYTCDNFEDDGDNKRYIRENLMYNHDTLPLGEFAIGTNTAAYVMARKYDIVDLLPILIVEKMGPHFAVGDTCYHHREDHPVYNPDGKEIMARDNEKSILREMNPSEAYFNCHTDITLPYDAIGFIEAIKYDGSHVEIIKDGRFVLEGTEYLNIPFVGNEKKR